MQQIINFLIRNKNNILFLLLLLFSLFLTIQSHSYQKSKFISSTNFFTGGIYSWTNDLDAYFHLKEYNQRLRDENQKLRNRLSQFKDTLRTSKRIDSTTFPGLYTFRAAEVINNNYSKMDNYLTINRGEKSGIAPDMGVITGKGIIGIVETVSNNYATIISILNSNSKINAQLKKSNHFGSLVWDGKNPNIVQLIDVPALAPIERGDTIITGGRSLIFPKGIPIGTIIDYSLDNSKSYYTIDIRLFNDMTNVGYVYVIENNDKEEILNLQKLTKDE
ncbi:MAG TPA: rod shape-determining protein MreC [Salinimicrobium sp.]|nr:rod shape-determining protein MreC [Salinimicrobium sp.]